MNRLEPLLLIQIALQGARLSFLAATLPTWLKMVQFNNHQVAIWLAVINISYGLALATGATMGSRLIGSNNEYTKMIVLTVTTTLSSALIAVSVSPVMMLVSRSISGLSDQYIPIANSLVARTYEGERLAAGLSKQTMARFAGFIFGAVLAGLLHGNSLHQGIAVLTAAMLIPMILLYQGRKEVQEACESRLTGNAHDQKYILDEHPIPSQQGAFRLWLVVYGLVLATQLTNVSAWPVYSMFKFDWHGRQVGLAILVFAALAIVSQLLVLPVLMRFLSEKKAIQLGLISVCLASLGYIFAQDAQQLFLIASLNLTAYCLEPLVKSLAIKRTTAQLRSRLISGMSSVSAFAFVGSGFWSNLLFIPYTTFPGQGMYLGLPFATSALLSITALMLVSAAGPRLNCMDGKPKQHAQT